MEKSSPSLPSDALGLKKAPLISSTTTIYESLSKQFSKHGMKLGLENMKKLDELLGSPSKSFASIHVGGTNGKGSVTTKIAKSLQMSGLKVGLYTSPHIATFRERIQVDEEMISHSQVEAGFALIKNFELTFFEFMTLLAFLHFRNQKVDVAVLEVGMGGRLDATNIVTPRLSVVTSISYDHSLYLGSTLEKIAEEKAGIIKKRVPIVVGPQAAKFPIFKKRAQEMNAPYMALEDSFENFEFENRAIAAKALDCLDFKNISRAGLEKTPACRFELFEREIPIILDVAHNPGAFEALFLRLEKQFPNKKIRALIALGKDKEIKEVLEVLCKRVNALHLTEAKSPRAARVDDLSRIVKECGFLRFECKSDVKIAFKNALRKAQEQDELLLVSGTFYIMADVRELLGKKEPRDESLISIF